MKKLLLILVLGVSLFTSCSNEEQNLPEATSVLKITPIKNLVSDGEGGVSTLGNDGIATPVEGEEILCQTGTIGVSDGYATVELSGVKYTVIWTTPYKGVNSDGFFYITNPDSVRYKGVDYTLYVGGEC